MGNICGMDIFQQLLAKYGDDFVKFIVGEKSKQFVGVKTEATKEIVGKQINGYREQVMGEINKQEERLDEQFQKYKTKLPAKIPSSFGTPEQLLGYKSFKQKFADLKKVTDERFLTARNEVNTQMDVVKDAAIKNINEQQPQVPLYSSLPSSTQKNILDRGQKEFAPQIEKATEAKGKELMGLMNPNLYIEKIKNLIPIDNVSGITQGATSKFENAFKMVSGGGFPGIGNFF